MAGTKKTKKAATKEQGESAGSNVSGSFFKVGRKGSVVQPADAEQQPDPNGNRAQRRAWKKQHRDDK